MRRVCHNWDCTNYTVKGKAQCGQCLEKGRKRAKKKRIKAKCKGLCTTCCLRKARKNSVICKKCAKYFLGWQRQKNCNISPENVDQQRKVQKNKCAICKKKFNKTPHADHDHKTKNFRGLLCSRCNHALGLFLESIRIMSNAIKYVRKHKRRKV